MLPRSSALLLCWMYASVSIGEAFVIPIQRTEYPVFSVNSAQLLPKTAKIPTTSHHPIVRSTTTLHAALPSSWMASLAAGQKALHADPSFVLTAVLLLSIFGVSLERRTMVGKALSVSITSPVCARIVSQFSCVPRFYTKTHLLFVNVFAGTIDNHVTCSSHLQHRRCTFLFTNL